uniref:Tektin n=1 Tax=Anopheles merus TaxID=30066 RepID=A0A182VFR4_ANOME
MSSKSAFNSCSYAQDIGRTESSKVFEIEQCMYNLSEDFFRQTTLQETVAPVESDTGVVSPEVFDESLNNAAASAAQSVHHIADILQRPISDELMRKLCFSELLLVCDGSETIVGGAVINVSLIAEEVLAAFSSTRLTILGHSTAESELMSFADRNCRPLQERKCETLISGTIRQLQTSPVGLPASDPPPYLPQRAGNSDGYPLAKPMGPIGPWATGRVDWGALSGQTGTRPVVNQYSITRYSVDEWRQRNADMINACETTVDHSVQVENASKNTIIRTYAIADKTQTDCTQSLHVRAKNIDDLKCELDRAISSMQEEIAALERQRRRLKQSLAVLRMPEAIANECLERRTGRPDTELIRDRPEEELIQEISLISEIKAILLQTLANIEQQQSDNRAVRQRMEFDWSEKKVAHENDAVNCNLRNQSTNTLFKPGATRCSNEQSTEIYWEKFTRETLDMYHNCRHKSEQLRNTLDAILTNAARDLRTQADSVERALASRISCMEEIREKLEIDLRTVLQHLADTEIQIDKLKVAIRNMDYAMMVVQTRLDNRNQRPRVENCRDQPQHLLIAEVKSLEVGSSAMNAQLKQEEDVKQELVDRRNELEREIMLKRRTIAIDRDRCQLLRSHFPSSTALSGY